MSDINTNISLNTNSINILSNNINMQSNNTNLNGQQISLKANNSVYNPINEESLVTKKSISAINSTATYLNGVVQIVTDYTNFDRIGFIAPSDFLASDTYTLNGNTIILTDLNDSTIYNAWKSGSPVELIIVGDRAYFRAGGGGGGNLPPLSPNFDILVAEDAAYKYNICCDLIPEEQATDLGGAEWYYGDHIPQFVGDGTKIEISKEELISGTNAVNKSTRAPDPISEPVYRGIEWDDTKYLYARQFTYNNSHTYNTTYVGAVASTDPNFTDGSEPPEPEYTDDSYSFLEMITQTTTWKPQSNGWYRIFCVGKSGDGINGSSFSTSSGGGGAGGGSAGIAIGTYYFTTTSSVEITINTSLTSFGEYMTATAGANGSGSGRQTTDAAGGVGGTANGGNKENLSGFTGGLGGRGYRGVSDTSSRDGGPGENNGALGGTRADGKNSQCGGGGGGARLPDCKYVASTLTMYKGGKGAGGTGVNYTGTGDGSLYPTTNPPTLYGGGCGGGGGRRGNSNIDPISSGLGSPGTPGCIIIERAVV